MMVPYCNHLMATERRLSDDLDATRCSWKKVDETKRLAQRLVCDQWIDASKAQNFSKFEASYGQFQISDWQWWTILVTPWLHKWMSVFENSNQVPDVDMSSQYYYFENSKHV